MLPARLTGYASRSPNSLTLCFSDREWSSPRRSSGWRGGRGGGGGGGGGGAWWKRLMNVVHSQAVIKNLRQEAAKAAQGSSESS